MEVPTLSNQEEKTCFGLQVLFLAIYWFSWFHTLILPKGTNKFDIVLGRITSIWSNKLGADLNWKTLCRDLNTLIKSREFTTSVNQTKVTDKSWHNRIRLKWVNLNIICRNLFLVRCLVWLMEMLWGKKTFFGSRNSRFVGSEVFKTTQSYKDACLRCHWYYWENTLKVPMKIIPWQPLNFHLAARKKTAFAGSQTAGVSWDVLAFVPCTQLRDCEPIEVPLCPKWCRTPWNTQI